MTPGWIEGHGHIMGIGEAELNLDLTEAKSYEEIVEQVKTAVEKSEPGEWIVGTGWHQDKWEAQPSKTIKGFPVHDALSKVSPENPVYLIHASRHAGFANSKAMEIAGVNLLSLERISNEIDEGGEVIRDALGNPTGLFNETAMALITKHIPHNNEERDYQALELAIKACLRHGITSFHDAGATRKSIELFKRFIS
jgi:predicted amidohydrolase YtcJ